MIVKQTSLFKRKVKKMHQVEKAALDQAILAIISDPTIGAMKIGDLSGIQVHKYKLKSQLYLLAYTYADNELLLLLTLIEHGTHENFYRDLKQH